jgi:hypothetical protein
MMVRFTAWLSRTESDMLSAQARRKGTSKNYLVRLAIREMLGLPAPETLETDKPESQRYEVRA